VAIYNALKNRPRKVTASIEGLAASAASVIVMAAKEIRATATRF
jgi:ATP-dependent protease ClpP protease subunit